MSGEDYHIPVLLNEVLEGMQIRENGVYIDCTFGGGGHSRAILSKLGPEGRLVVFDQDEDARANLPNDSRVLFLPHNFRHLGRFLKLHRIPPANAILADLGVSSHQFDEAERGFSIRFDADLDMRMDKRLQKTAAEVVNQYSESELHKLFEQYGEVTNSKTLAKTIVQVRGLVALKTIANFKQALHPVVKGNPNKYFAQIFQALRIEVNEELEALKELLQQLPAALAPGGLAAIITFHSLEDRLVKNFFRKGSFEEEVETDAFGVSKVKAPFKPVNKKPVVATEQEMKRNPRSRSAKLRIAEKID